MKSQSFWFWLHAIFLSLGLAGFITAVFSALMYLIQSAQLKSKHPGKMMIGLPSLDLLDRTHFFSLTAGVLLFTSGMLAGILWAEHLPTLQNVFLDPIVIMSLLAVGLYWMLFALRVSSLRRGKRIALSTVAVFLFVVFTLGASTYCPAGFHMKGHAWKS